MLAPYFQLAASGTTDSLQDNEYIVALGSGPAKWDGDSSESTMVYLVKWSKHLEFIDRLMGTSTYEEGGTNTSNLYRDPPQPHPRYFQHCVHADGLPDGFDPTKRAAGQQQLDEYEFPTAQIARVTATYRALAYDVYSDEEFGNQAEYNRYCWIDHDFNIETINATGRMLFCSGSNQGLDHPPPIYTGVRSLMATWYDIPADPSNKFVPANQWAINACCGRVNSVGFLGYGAGCVLFLAPKLTPKKPNAANGNRLFDVHMPFLVRDNGFGISYYDGTNSFFDEPDEDDYHDWAGHNYFYNQYLGANARFDLMTHDGKQTGRKTYYTADHNDLFKLQAS